MKKETKAEVKARESVAAFAAEPTESNRRAAWEAVWDVSLTDGWWDKVSRIVWFTMLNSVTGEKRLIPCGMSGEVTLEEVRYRFGHCPKPEEEKSSALVAELVKLRASKTWIDSVTADLRRLVPHLKDVVANVATLVEGTDTTGLKGN